MKRVNGAYQNGTVTLDEPVDWPQASPVEVLCQKDPRVAAPVDMCFDGAAWEDSPEAIHQWIDWFDQLVPMFTDEELNHFNDELRFARAKQKAQLPQWEHKIAQLLK